MSLLYFSNLHSSVSENVLRDAIKKSIVSVGHTTNKHLFTLNLQLPDAPTAGSKNIAGAGTIRFHNAEMLEKFMAKLKIEPIMFESQTVQFSFEPPRPPEPSHSTPSSSSRPVASTAVQIAQSAVTPTHHTSRRAGAPTMNLNKIKHTYGHRPRNVTPRLNPMILRKEQHRLSILGEQPRLKMIHFGVLRNNKFSIEYSKDLLSTAGYLKFDDDEKTMRIIVGGTHQVGDSLIPSVAIAIQTVTWVGLGNDGHDDYMFLELVQHPHFEQGDQFRSIKGDAKKDAKGSRTRLSQLDESHGLVAPYASRWIKITFHEDTEFIPSEEICFEAGLPQPIMDPRLIFESTRRVYSPSNIELVENWLRDGSLPWEVAFQCEALLRNGTLIPMEIMLLKPMIEQVTGESAVLACDALKSLQDELKGSGARSSLTGFEDETVVSIFQKHIAQARQSTGGHLQNSASTFICHHVKVTPTAIHLDGPYAEQSNRVIRRYPGYESYFIRVNFKDEGESRTRLEFEVDTQSFSEEWIGRFLKIDGIKLGDRHYRLLGYSSSGFREHACFFSADFVYEGVLVTPDSIRASLGEFSKVLRCPARYGARMSQAFSSTDPSIILSPRQITYIPDIMNSDGEIFSDGCGTISRALAEKVWKAWVARMPETRRRQRHKDEPIPAAFQFRMGGCKGMVRIDPKLEGEQLCIRPSMTKFDAPNELGFEIARAFERASPCFLNRPLVMLLVSNGVDAAAFEHLMDETLKSIKKAMETFNGVRSMLVSNRLGRPFRLGDTFGKLSSLGLELNQPGVQSVGLHKLLNATLYHVKLGLKHKARIEVPNSHTLVGVCDEDGYLRPRDIYACVQTFDHKTGEAKPYFITGWVLVSRSPYIHPGDCQMLYAIGEPPEDSPFAGEGNHLPNCIVFSSRGYRPVPNMLGGGDLDGDLFNVIRLPELMPPHEYAPASYPPAVLRTINQDSTMDDVADFMVEFICKDSVAMIAVNHLVIAATSRDGARNMNCLKNAELHSMAVDFYKTGIPVPGDDIRKPRYNIPHPVTGLGLRPDWQVGHGRDPSDGYSYECPSVLGKLFRAVELPPTNPARDGDEDPQDFVDSNAILKVLASHVAKYQSQIRLTYAEATTWVQALLRCYTRELKHICVSHTVAIESTEQVSEVEVMLGTNLESAENNSLVERMKLQTENLADFVRSELQGEPDGDPHDWLARAWRAYTLTSAVDFEKPGAFSFSWIALGSVLTALSELDKSFLSVLPPVRSLTAEMAAYSEGGLDLDKFADVDRESWPWIDKVKKPKYKQNEPSHHPVLDLNGTADQDSAPLLEGSQVKIIIGGTLEVGTMGEEEDEEQPLHHARARSGSFELLSLFPSPVPSWNPMFNALAYKISMAGDLLHSLFVALSEQPPCSCSTVAFLISRSILDSLSKGNRESYLVNSLCLASSFELLKLSIELDKQLRDFGENTRLPLIGVKTTTLIQALGLYGAFRALTEIPGPMRRWRFAAPHFGIACIGVGSFIFHATLKWYAQVLLDEMPMIYVSSMVLYLVLAPSGGSGSLKLKLSVAAIPLTITAVYLNLPYPIIHQVCFAAIMLTITYRLVFLLKESAQSTDATHDAKYYIITGALMFITAFGIWNVDNMFCDVWTTIRSQLWEGVVGPSFRTPGVVAAVVGAATQGHAWWHLLTGLGCARVAAGASYLILNIAHPGMFVLHKSCMSIVPCIKLSPLFERPETEEHLLGERVTILRDY